MDIARERNRTENEINSKIDLIHANNPTDPRLDELRLEQKKFYELKANGAKIRSRVKWHEEGEKPTRFFHALEEKNYSDRTWTRMDRRTQS